MATEVNGRTFDRIPQFDEKSRAFPIRTLVPTHPVSRTWQAGPVLDQGPDGACVGFSWGAEMLAVPKAVDSVDDAFAFQLYQEAQRFDDFPGEDYEGSSVLGGAKVVRSMGYMPEYRWAFGADDLLLAVGHNGPAVIGINWYDSMFTPNFDGLVTVGGVAVGGHAIMVRGVRLRAPFASEPVFRLRNSWGPGWGVNGDCYVTLSDMRRLLSEEGEACVPTRRNRKPVPVADE